jgi:hypothetical protein
MSPVAALRLVGDGQMRDRTDESLDLVPPVYVGTFVRLAPFFRPAI